MESYYVCVSAEEPTNLENSLHHTLQACVC